MRVAVCDYRAGNVRSVRAAFERLGATVELAAGREAVLEADLAVLPGVGSAASAMAVLRERELDGALRERHDAGGPILGICLGLQLALDESEEDGGVDGTRAHSRACVPAARGARPADRLGAGRPGR